MNDLIILAMLADGPKHGYQLKREAGFLLGHGDMHNNLVYPLLRRFTADGWVTKKTVPGKRGQTRQTYALTATGRRELVNRLSNYGEADASSAQAFITRVGMFELLPHEARSGILDHREGYLRARAARLTGLVGHTDLGAYGSEVVRHLIDQTRSDLAWIRRLRRLITTKTEALFGRGQEES
jgi:DNA-binding PadR family transcriptional regulator